MIDAESHYRTAQELLGLDRESDRRVAQRLSDALADHEAIHPEEVEPELADAVVQVLGPRPGGAEDLDAEKPIVAAGGAVRQALSAGIQPTLVVTDLDGSDMAHEMFSRAGVPMAVHGHGDNRALVDRLLPELEGPMFGTSQTDPPDDPVPLHRFGGFTDGDRACFIAAALGARSVELVGWDFEEPIGGDPVKQKKLNLAARLLEDLAIPLRVQEPREPEVASFEELDLGDSIPMDVEDPDQPE
jgi:uncharacterized Rossmann fold enzyme